MRNQVMKFLVLHPVFFVLLSFIVEGFSQRLAVANQKNTSVTSLDTTVLSESRKTAQLTNRQKDLIFSLSQNSEKKSNMKIQKDFTNAEDKTKKVKQKEAGSYSFRPLLIQGKKRLIQKAKDMKVESGNIVESQLFFVDIDFEKRIFE